MISAAKSAFRDVKSVPDVATLIPATFTRRTSDCHSSPLRNTRRGATFSDSRQ